MTGPRPYGFTGEYVLMEIHSARKNTKDLLSRNFGAGLGGVRRPHQPVGDFPLNDDWAYGLPVEVLLRDHKLRFTDWQWASLVAQVCWGAACLPGGFSYTALRSPTLT